MTKQVKMIGMVVIVVIAAGVIGWYLGSRKHASNQAGTTSSSNMSESSAAGDPLSLVKYTLPDGWEEGACPDNPSKIFMVPAGSDLRCGTASIAPISISIDPQNTKDCQQLNAPQNVKKHICKSLFINGHKTLQALTETDKTVANYYIDTGKGVVKVEYVYSSSNTYQTQFDQLANSVTVK